MFVVVCEGLKDRNVVRTKKTNPSVLEILIQLKSMEGNLKKLDLHQIGNLDRLKKSLADKNEKAAEEYMKKF